MGLSLRSDKSDLFLSAIFKTFFSDSVCALLSVCVEVEGRSWDTEKEIYIYIYIYKEESWDLLVVPLFVTAEFVQQFVVVGSLIVVVFFPSLVAGRSN